MSLLPAFASIEDLTVRIPGGIADEDQERALAALDDASTEIRAFAGRSWTTTNDSDEVVLDLPSGDDAWRADILVKVTCSVAKRVMDNPEGVSQRQESLGAYSGMETFPNATGDVYLTSSEKSDVLRAAGSTGGVSTIQTTRSDLSSTGVPVGLETNRCDGGDTVYLPVSPEGQDIPFSYEPLSS